MGQYRIMVFSLSVGMCWFSLYSCIPILAPYAKELGASYDMIGLIVGGYGLAQMLMRLPLGILSDRVNRRKIFIVISMGFCAVSSLGIWLYPNVISLLFFRALAGIAASSWVVQAVLYASYYPASRISQAMGNVSAISCAGEMAGMSLAGLVAYYFGTEAIFLLGAVAGVLGLVLSFFIIETREQKQHSIGILKLLATAKDGRLTLTASLACLVQFMTFGTVFGFTPLAAKNIGANDFELGMIATLFILPGIVASVLSGPFFASRFGEKKSVIVSFIVAAISCLVIPFITSINVLYMWQVIGGFARGLMFPLLMGLSIGHIPSEKRATAMGYFQAVYGFGMFLGPMTVGWAGSHLGLDWGFWIIAVVTLLGAVITKLYLREEKPIAQITSC